MKTKKNETDKKKKTAQGCCGGKGCGCASWFEILSEIFGCCGRKISLIER